MYGFVGATVANQMAWSGSMVPLMIAYYIFKNKVQHGVEQ